MPKAFDATNPPFDRLTATEIEELRGKLDIGYFRPGETVIARGAPSDTLYTVIKGAIEERDSDGPVSVHGARDVFDSRAVVHGTAGNAFVAREESLCYMLPKATTLDLIRRNAGFAAFFYREISDKLESYAKGEENRQVDTLMRSRVKDVFLHPAVFIDGAAPIEEAGRMMKDRDTNALFVRDGWRVGVVTGMNLSKAVILNRKPLETPVAEVAHYDVVTVQPNDFIFAALLQMTKHNKRRLAVKEGHDFVGMLEDIDLLGFLAGNSQVVAGRIDRAVALDDLKLAAAEIGTQVARLNRQGVKWPAVAEITSDLNRRLLARTFDLVAPREVKAKGCLIVMGSEGRAEQTIRTDQDNGLILAEAVPDEALAAFRTDFFGALERFGFPPCPGNVMVSNPLWSQTLDGFKATFRNWVMTPDENSHMNVAIFADATCVAGDAALLDDAKKLLFDLIRGEKAYLAHFARAIDQFGTPIGVFNQLVAKEGDTGDAIDLKKGGIFPIVHGMRALAVELGLTDTSTTKRISLVAAWGTFDSDFARELTQSFQFLQDLALAAKIEARTRANGHLNGPGAANGHAGETPLESGMVRPGRMSNIERDLLRDSLYVVKQFREIIRRHFNLTVF